MALRSRGLLIAQRAACHWHGHWRGLASVPLGVAPLPAAAADARVLSVAVLGLPNVGKSTLLNALIGRKVSITSPRQHTTRRRMLGVLTHESTQIVFLDTPGLMHYQSTLRSRVPRSLLVEPRNCAAEADVVLTMVDERCARKRDRRDFLALYRTIIDAGDKEEEEEVVGGDAPDSKPNIAVINKIDLVPSIAVPHMRKQLGQQFISLFETSAHSGRGVEALRAHLLNLAKPGQWLYDEHTTSDLPLPELIAEAVREQLLLQLHQELPYVVTHNTLSIKEQADSICVQQEMIIPPRKLKGLYIGKDGARIQSVIDAAEVELALRVGKPVRLKLTVRH